MIRAINLMLGLPSEKQALSSTGLAGGEDAIYPGAASGFSRKAEHEATMKENTTKRWEKLNPNHLSRVLD